MAQRIVTRKTIAPEVYARLFENSPEGLLVLEDLAARYGANPFRKGGHEADRQTAFHAGENNVVNFITAQIHRAHHPDEVAPDVDE